MNKSDREIKFYYREGCHLCEEMAAVLYQDWAQHYALMCWTSVDSDPALESLYGTQVPVLEVEGRLVCRYFPDMDKLTACFGPAANPV